VSEVSENSAALCEEDSMVSDEKVVSSENTGHGQGYNQRHGGDAVTGCYRHDNGGDITKGALLL
jgi:hypothetical protein